MTRYLLLLVAFLISTSCAQQPSISGDAIRAARELDETSKTKLGLSLNAVSLLLDADQGTAYPANAVNITVRRKALDELVNKGFAKVTDTSSSQAGGYIFVERTTKGEAVAKELLD